MKYNLIEINKKSIRKVIYENETFYVLNDLIEEITSSKNPKEYIQSLKYRNLEFSRCITNCTIPLEIKTKGGI